MADEHGSCIERKLRQERDDVDGHVVPARRTGSREADDESGPDAVPGRREENRHALAVAVRSDVLDQATEQQAGGDAERHDARRQEKEHREEHELRRHRRPGADLELDLGDHGVQRDQEERHAERERRLRGNGESAGEGCEDERRPEQERHGSLAPEQARAHPLARRRDLRRVGQRPRDLGRALRGLGAHPRGIGERAVGVNEPRRRDRSAFRRGHERAQLRRHDRAETSS